MTIPVVSDNPAIQRAYEQARAEGASHNIAEICAFRQCPGLHGTDTRFFAGRHGLQFEDNLSGKVLQEAIKRDCRRAGVGVPTSGTYISGLARYPGDRQAIVDSVGDIKRICRDRGLTARGSVEHKGPPPDPEPEGPYAVAPDLIEKEMKLRIADNPDAAATPRDREQLREEVTKQLTPEDGVCG